MAVSPVTDGAGGGFRKDGGTHASLVCHWGGSHFRRSPRHGGLGRWIMGVMTSRREFLQATSLAAALGAAGRSAQLKTLGVQLYTVRGVLPQKPQETLKAIRAIGYQEVEATYAGLDALWPALQESGLKPVSIHLDSKSVTQGNPMT